MGAPNDRSAEPAQLIRDRANGANVRGKIVLGRSVHSDGERDSTVVGNALRGPAAKGATRCRVGVLEVRVAPIYGVRDERIWWGARAISEDKRGRRLRVRSQRKLHAITARLRFVAP